LNNLLDPKTPIIPGPSKSNQRDAAVNMADSFTDLPFATALLK
jgi:hypothetical protein